MAGDDKPYIAWLHRQPCAQCKTTYSVEAHHHTKGRGRGQRGSDREAFPLCKLCHHLFHAAAGIFRSMDKAARRKWQDDQVAIHRERYFAAVGEAASMHYTTSEVLTQLQCPDDYEEIF